MKRSKDKEQKENEYERDVDKNRMIEWEMGSNGWQKRGIKQSEKRDQAGLGFLFHA